MPYTPQTWTDSPSTSTPISAARLGVMETGIQGAYALGESAVIPRLSTYYYGPSIPIDQTDGGGGLTTGTAEFAPFFVTGGSQSFDRIACNVGTAGSASSVIRLGVYRAHATTGMPDAMVFDAGTVAADSTGDKIVTISQTLTPGFYWLVMVTNSTGCSVRKTAGSAIQHSDWIKGGDGLDYSGAGVAVRTSGWTATSALPGTAILTSPLWRRIDVPLVFLRKA